jgi:hypothetical protein
MPVCKVLPSCNACLQLNDVEAKDNWSAGESLEVITRPGNKQCLMRKQCMCPR